MKILVPFLICLQAAACTGSSKPEKQEKKILNARRVSLYLDKEDGSVVVKGDSLTLDLDTMEMTFKGNASISAKEPVTLQAGADEIKLRGSFEKIELSGSVHAVTGPGNQGLDDGGSGSQ